MELKTISQVSKSYGISVRMLRYYEKEGLLDSKRRDNYAYRVYDDAAIQRLRQIIILRKLRIPVKQIKDILNNQNAAAAIEIFERNIGALDEELTALSTIRNILKQLVDELQAKANITIQLDVLADPSLLPIVDSLPFTKHQIKETLTMDALNKASDVLNKLRNVRVVYVPPMTIASAFFTGENAGDRAWEAITDLVKQSNLLVVKPDLRVFRIDHSNATGQSFGYEVWVSIPDNFDVPAPLTKKKFLGGQYAAHLLGEEDGFSVWLGLQDWVNESENYQYDISFNRVEPPLKELDSFGGLAFAMEEVLNFYNDQSPPNENRIEALEAIKNYIPADEAPVIVVGIEEKCGYKASIVTKPKFRIFGFSKIMNESSGSPEDFINELKADGRLDIVNKFRKPGTPILSYGSHDMDSHIRGGWRFTVCLEEGDITSVSEFCEHIDYSKKLDTSKWLIFEHKRSENFDAHAICMQAGYVWNGIISGSLTVYPNDTIATPQSNSTVYHRYPVK